LKYKSTKMTKAKFWTSDKLVSFSAIFISLLTLFIFFKQTNIIEEQNHLSVMPYFMMETSNNSDLQRFSIDLENHGVGPGFIESRVIFYKGQVYEMEFIDFLKQNVPKMDSVVTINYATLQTGLALSAGHKRNVITVGGGATSYRTFLQIMQEIQKEGFNYEIRYKSVYNDHWSISAESDVPIAK